MKKFRTQFTEYNSDDYGFKCEGESRTQQQFKEECDVNNILYKYKKSGMLNHVNKTQGQFGDFANVEDYQTSLQKVMQAQQNFMELPSELRSKFNNDPSKLIDFINTKENYEECVKYGLIIPRKKDPTLQESLEIALENNDKKREAKIKKD